jgi:hypothetical protein
MNYNFRLILLTAAHPNDVLAQTLAPTPETALDQISGDLRLEERLELCPTGSIDGKYRLERVSLGWASVEQTWEARVISHKSK